MEIIATLLVTLFVFTPIIGGIALIGAALSKPSIPAYKQCENRVSNALRNMDMKSYVIFDNLILESDRNTSHTEIDHVVVSPYGIFCIETKSHQGLIYGSAKHVYWQQYLGNKSYQIYNPFRQNYKHVKALEALLGANFKAPIHSYVVFPNASQIKIDGTGRAASIRDVVSNISRHKTQIYNLQECERILKILAYASSRKEGLVGRHRDEVRAYVASI